MIRLPLTDSDWQAFARDWGLNLPAVLPTSDKQWQTAMRTAGLGRATPRLPTTDGEFQAFVRSLATSALEKS